MHKYKESEEYRIDYYSDEPMMSIAKQPIAIVWKNVHTIEYMTSENGDLERKVRTLIRSEDMVHGFILTLKDRDWREQSIAGVLRGFA